MFKSVFLALLVLFLTSHVRKNELKPYTNWIVNEYRQGLHEFSGKLHVLKRRTASVIPEEKLKTDFLAARLAFKKIEFFLVYSDSKEVRKINGPNLQSSEYDSLTPMDMVYPHGLQVIEDLIYNPEEGSRAELQEEVDLLCDLISKITKRIDSMTVLDDLEFHILLWDAMRIELFRIETLGITGFDVPDSQNALPETEEALRGMLNTIKLYASYFKSSKETTRYKAGINLFKKALQKLRNASDFNSFDRLDFCVTDLHALSTWINETRQCLEFNYPTNFSAVDQKANHLFSPDFFSMEYFSPGSTPEKLALGKKLFEDPILSSDLSRSCKTCHDPMKGFADGMAKNTSVVDGSFLLRNTPSLWNVTFQTKLFYDSRSKKLEKQALDVIHNEAEMGGDLKKVVKLIQANPSYQSEFKKAYNGEISELTLVNALSVYVRSLISLNTRFDQYMQGDLKKLTADEKNGFNLFTGKAKCATCHFLPLFNGLVPPYFKETESEILGVPFSNKNAKLDTDLGKFGYTGLEIHRFSFKTPSLRNLDKTAPYMHNGIYSELDQVIDFYNKGGGLGLGFELNNQTLSSDSLGLTSMEQKQIISFLKSLNAD